MWYVSESALFKTVFYGALLTALAGCGQPSGNAPGGSVPAPSPIPVTSTNTAIMKYGDTVTTSGGWTVSIDNSDSVESSTLANGWTVEVLRE